MFYLGKKPTDDVIRGYLNQCQDIDFNYAYVGCTSDLIDRGNAPPGFRLDRYSIVLGEGEDIFDLGSQAICKWEMFNHAMATLKWHDTPIQSGNMVAVLFKVLSQWTANPARIVYTLNAEREGGKYRQFGFAYGTVPGHIEKGEECFQVDWDQESDIVRFRITVISRPGSILSLLGKPIVNFQQKRFRKLAGQAMVSAVTTTSSETK